MAAVLTSPTLDQARALIAAAGYGGETAPAIGVELARLATSEGLAPLLGARIEERALDTGDEVAAMLVSAYRQCARANAALALGSEVFAGRLVQAGIPVLLLKGAALVRSVYRDPGQRSMADVDLLVPTERWGEALAVARRAGARMIDAPRRRITLRHFHEAHLALPAGGMVDLHRRLSPWPMFAVDHAELFAGARPQADALLLPTPAALFVSLAMHAAKDGFFLPLRSLVDGLALIAAGTVEAEAVVDLARRWAARRATARYLQLLARFGSPPSPWPELAKHLAPRLGPAPPILGLERPAQPSSLGHRLRCRRRFARLQDTPLRPVVYDLLWLLRFGRDLVESPWTRSPPGTHGDES